MIIDKLAYSSRLCGTDVRVKITFALLMLAACIISASPAVNAAAFIFISGVTLIKGRTPIKSYAHMLSVPLVFMIVSTVTIAFTAGEGQEYYLSFAIGDAVFGIGKIGFHTGIRSMIKALSAVGCMYFLALSTPMVQLFSFMDSTRIPEFIVELCQLIYRYVFVLLDAAGAIKTAQESRLGYETFKSKYRSTAQLGAMMFIRAYKQADRTYTALESRGYNGNLRLLRDRGQINKGQAVLSVLIPAVFVTAAVILR